MATNLEQLRAKYPHLSDDAIADLADVSMKMAGNPKTRKPFLGLLKDTNPDQVIPELDTDAKIDAALKTEREAREKLEQSLKDERFAAALASQKNDAKSKFGLSDDDMGKMEEMMKKGELPADYRFAPQLYKMQTETAAPTNYGTGGYGPLDLNRAVQDKGFEGLMEDPDNWSRTTAHSMVDDMQKKGRAPAF